MSPQAAPILDKQYATARRQGFFWNLGFFLFSLHS